MINNIGYNKLTGLLQIEIYDMVRKYPIEGTIKGTIEGVNSN
jgi:hypothetical protein